MLNNKLDHHVWNSIVVKDGFAFLMDRTEIAGRSPFKIFWKDNDIFDDRQVTQMREQLEREHDRKMTEIREAARRMKDECSHQVEMER